MDYHKRSGYNVRNRLRAPFFPYAGAFIGNADRVDVVDALQSRADRQTVWVRWWWSRVYRPALLISFRQVVMLRCTSGRPAQPPIGHRIPDPGGRRLLAPVQMFNAVSGVAVGAVTLAFLMFHLVSAGGIYPRRDHREALPGDPPV